MQSNNNIETSSWSDICLTHFLLFIFYFFFPAAVSSIVAFLEAGASSCCSVAPFSSAENGRFFVEEDGGGGVFCKVLLFLFCFRSNIFSCRSLTARLCFSDYFIKKRNKTKNQLFKPRGQQRRNHQSTAMLAIEVKPNNNNLRWFTSTLMFLFQRWTVRLRLSWNLAATDSHPEYRRDI